MGQIVGLKAKPKRCNLNALGSVPTPAAGEYILVSYDNSMTANGQGNFDRYIMGDGRTAATELELKYLDDSTHPYIVEEVNKAVADIQPIEITGDVTNAPDEEDLTSEKQGNTDVLKFKDKAYNSALYSGLGRTYLRKNIVTLEGVGKNVLTQAMVNQANTIYHIQYDYDLNGQTITMPAGCVLEFEGGSVKNGTIVSNETEIVAPNTKIFSGVTFVNWNIPFNARWFVSKVNSTVLDDTLYDCSTELNYALNSGISILHFSNDVYYIANTLQVEKNVALTGDMKVIETFAAWNDSQRPNVLNNDKFRGLYTDQGITIIDYGHTGLLTKELSIDGVNFITDYYYKDDTYNNSIPVVKIRAASVWGLRISGSVVSMTKAQTPRGTGILLSCYNASGYIADANIMGSVSGFDKCVDTQNNGGWINGLQLLCSLTGYQGCVGNANGVFAKGVFQAAGSKIDNVDAFFELENRFILASLVYDLNGGGRAHYAVKRESEENFTDIATAYNPEYHCIKRGIKKTYKLLDYVLNSSFRKCLESATITSRLYNSDTDEDIPYVLNNMSEFGTLDTNVFTSGTNIDMNDGNAFSADVIDNVTFNLNIKTNYNELFIEQLRTYFVYLYREHIGNYQSFKYLDVEIKDNSNRVVLSKLNIELQHYGTEVIDIIQEWMQSYGSNRYTFNLTWHSLTKTTTSVYIGAIGVCNLLGNQPEVTNINVYKDLTVNQIIPKNKNDKSLFYSPNLSRTIGGYNFATIYLGTLTFTSKSTQEAAFLKGYISRHNICYASEFEIQAFKLANANATFKILCGIGSDANDNEVELHYELTETSTTLAYDLYLKTQGPTSRTYITITELRQMNYNNVTFAMLYPATHTGGTTTLIGYFGTSGNNTKTNTLLASTSYAPASTWYDKTNKRVLYYAGDVLGWIDSSDGVAASVKRSGTFAQKPSASDIYVGYQYWCTDKQTTEGATNGIPIWHQGSDVWVDALGRVVS